jgi:signal transduction histidine kinase
LLEHLKEVTNDMIENVSEEIDKRRQTEKALAVERQRLYSLLDELPMYVYLQGKDHSIRFANRCFKEHFGVPNGKACYEVINNTHRPCERCKPFQVFETGLPIEWEWERKNGKTYQVFDYPFTDHDGNPLVLELGIYITKRKEAQRERREIQAQLHQVQKMEALGILAGSIVHDFNNLLMVIQSDAAMMLREAEPETPHYEKLKSITQEVRKGAALLDQMLGFARGGTSTMIPTDLNELVQETAEMFGKSKPEIHIHLAFQSDLWAVKIDPGRIEQVLLNLFINASDAMPEGGDLLIETENMQIEKKDKIHYWTEPGPYAKVRVTDRGMGMDKETQLRAFEPFFTSKPKGRGTGLGLASAYGIIKDHDGIIYIDSSVGVGTTVEFCLPAIKGEAA